MLVTHLTYCCVGGHTNAHKAASYADVAIGAALVAIALLGMFKVIAMPTTVTLPLIGAGATYAGFSILHILVNCKRSMACSKNAFLVKEEFAELDSEGIEAEHAETNLSDEG